MTVWLKRKKLTFKKRFTNGQFLKAWLTPQNFKDGRVIWNFSIAVSRSIRQLNDWDQARKNKRAAKLRASLSGQVGSAALIEAARITRKCFHRIPNGDAIVFQCMSGLPDKQIRVFKKWLLERELLPWEFLESEQIFFLHKL